eukprot:scaffold5581_cov156-Skeletonema_marinoi.AAC.14
MFEYNVIALDCITCFVPFNVYTYCQESDPSRQKVVRAGAQKMRKRCASLFSSKHERWAPPAFLLCLCMNRVLYISRSTERSIVSFGAEGRQAAKKGRWWLLAAGWGMTGGTATFLPKPWFRINLKYNYKHIAFCSPNDFFPVPYGSFHDQTYCPLPQFRCLRSAFVRGGQGGARASRN